LTGEKERKMGKGKREKGKGKREKGQRKTPYRQNKQQSSGKESKERVVRARIG
jgi:hypothetical protein